MAIGLNLVTLSINQSIMIFSELLLRPRQRVRQNYRMWGNDLWKRHVFSRWRKTVKV